jgi:hypothetical protein
MPAAKDKSMTVASYLASLPADRAKTMRAVYRAVKKAMPKGYTELFGYGMIMWSVPLSVLPDTYNGHPLCYVGLAAQKNYFSLHLMGPYGNKALRAELEAGFKKAGIRLDMGQSCVRFKDLDAVALDVCCDVIGKVPMARYVEMYQSVKRK